MNYETRKVALGYATEIAQSSNLDNPNEILSIARRFLEFLEEDKPSVEQKTFDFGNGPVPAHQHSNGGGWVADTAMVENTAYVGPNARVYGYAWVYGNSGVRQC